MTNRLFITLDIPEAAIMEVLKLRDELHGGRNVRWEQKQKLHITLKFLGDTDADNVKLLSEMLENISKNHSPLSLEFNKFGIFYADRKPRVFWIGTKDDEKILKLHSEVDNACNALGYSKENKNFSSHLTLLRVKGSDHVKQLEKMKQHKFNPIKFTSNTISLMKSELKPAGSVYTTIKSFELRKTEE